jgi:hypothetical protein
MIKIKTHRISQDDWQYEVILDLGSYGDQRTLATHNGFATEAEAHEMAVEKVSVVFLNAFNHGAV